MSRISIKRASVLLLMSLIICLMAVLSASAAEVTVDIVSFMRGPQEDLQSSELLEARVIGYEGNTHDLTYKWTNEIGTYLYVYNSHNMYNINNTEGEIEIYPNGKSGLSNMVGFTYKKTFSGKGYAWAAVYGADVNSADLVGTITVEVYDANGTLLAKDTHEGYRERTGGFIFGRYTYHGIVTANLSVDLDQVSFGMFEGDTRNVKDLLGEASIVHITCEECSVTTGRITSGSQYISLSGNVQDDYYITGLSKGSGTAEVTITKGNCKFHKNTSATATTTAYVYRKPTTTSTATAIELDNLDPDCRYFIAGVEGTPAKDKNGEDIVIFEELTPNTKYEIEVVGHTEGTLPVYAYVYETTKPAHTGTVEIILNGYYDADTGTAVGTRIDISEVIEGCEKPYVRYENSELYFALEKTATGTYTSILSNGTYHIYSAARADAQICDQLLTIDDANRTRELFFFTVEYDAAGGEYAPATLEYHHDTHDVSVSSTKPYKEGYIFTGWKDEDGNLYSAGSLLTNSISKPYTLTAQYVEATDIYVNISIRHLADDGNSINNDRAKHNITFTVDQKSESDHDFTEIFSKTINWDGVLENFTDDAYEPQGISLGDADYTTYTAKSPTVANVPKNLDYTVTTRKSGYTLSKVENEYDENGDLHINVALIYDPHNVDLTFEVELDEESKALPDELKPAAVNVKINCWHNTPHDEHYGLPENDPTVDWYAISQHHYTYERVALDENGHGIDTFPIWPETTYGLPYHFRIEVVSYELKDGTIVHTTNLNNDHTTYVCELERYVSTVSVTNGKDPDLNDEDLLSGVYFNKVDGNYVQQGNVKATVKIYVYDVTFNPNGGVLGGSEGTTTVKDQILVPDLSKYVPTREGGYTFGGWHLDGETVNSGDVLREDITLVASWIEPITIKGTVSASTLYYDENGESHPILGDFKLAHAYLLLQKIDSTGYGITVKSVDIPLTYADNTLGVGSYEFSEIPNDGTKYRIDIISASYEDRYQNETSSSTNVSDFHVYDESHYVAELNGDNEAVVNAYMFFDPAVFDLQYKIDATAIGDGYKPSNVEMLVLYNDFNSGMNPQRWPVISQMLVGETYVGQDTALTNGIGDNAFPVWSYEPDDSALFEYSIRVDGVDGATYDHSNPCYFVEYNGSARFDDIHAMTEDEPETIDGETETTLNQTKLLTALFVPRRYTVTFELNAKEGDVVEGMEDYLTVYNTHETEYTWSYGTLISATPSKAGYKFLGWYDEGGNKVEAISADMHKNITLYAKWLPTVTFSVMSDAGYYAPEYDADEQVGVISFNAYISGIDVAKDYITSFGIYVYNATGDILKTTVDSVKADTLTEDGGYFHTVVSNIAKSNFATKVVAIPFVVLDSDGNPETGNDSEIVLGDAMMTAVSDINKWLGDTNPYTE